MPGGGFMVQTAEQAAKDLAEACDSSAQTISKNLITKVADTEEANLGRTLEGEAKNTQGFTDVMKSMDGDGDSAAGSVKPPTGDVPKTGGGAPASKGPVDDDFKEGNGGQPEEGNGASTTGGTDPVDVVTGQLLSAKVDVALPGVLPLVLRRAYASGYGHGRLLGPGWSSTLDQRLVVDSEGIHYLGDDAQALSYPIPASGQQVLPGGGARWPLTWDRELDAITVLDPDSGLTRHFAAPPSDTPRGARGRHVRHLTRITDRNGNWLNITRDSDGVPTLVDHCGGYRIGVDSSYRAGGFRVEALRRIDAAHPEGVPLVRYGYDPRGRLVEIVDSTDLPLVYEYDAADRITAWIDRGGYRYEYVYDDAGRVVRASGEDGTKTSELAYDPEERVTRVTNSFGDTTEYHYDRYQHVCKTVDPLGAVTLTESDRYGRVLSSTDALGSVSRFSLDEQGQPVRIERPDGTSVTIEYDELGKPVSIAGPDGSVYRYTYDASGNTTSATDPAGATTVYEYDDRGGLIRVTDPLGGTTSAELDRAGLLTSVRDRTGAAWSFVRDEAGRVLSVTDPLGAVATTVYDGEGRPVSRTHPDGTTEYWSFDVNGNETSHTDRGGHTTAYEYGPFHALRARIDPGGVVYRFTHDAELRLVEVTNPQGLTWDYRFDAANNLIGESDFNDRALTYGYDAAGRLVSRVNGVGEQIEWRRDALGRVVEQRSGEAATLFEYEADGLLRRVSDQESSVEFERDAARRVIAESVNGRSLTKSYDAVGRQIGRATPSGRTSSWTYDAAGRAQQLLAGEQQISFGYSEAGNETYRWIGDRLALTSEWDQSGRLTGRSVLGVTGPEEARTSAVLHQRSWIYEAAGSPISVADSIEGTRRLTLDPLGRVTAVTAEGWSEQYGYDAAGNITRAVDSRADGGESEAEPRQLTGTLLRRAGRTAYTYDAQGRLVKAVRRTLSGTEKVWSYAYDAQDRLIEAVNPAGERWRYAYDPLNRRTAKRRLDAAGEVVEEIRFTWDGSVLAEQEHVHAGTELVTATVWDYEPGTWTPLAQDRRSYLAQAPQELIDQQFHAIVTDLVGTPTELVTAEGEIAWRRQADLWGRASADGDTLCPLGFPGQYHDAETGLAYNHNRYYDPDTGRYTTPDPLGLDPAPNHHAYVPNPLTSADPLGLDAEGGYTDLYHATNSAGAANIRNVGVDPTFGPRPMDFGNGFYTTRDIGQAESWASKRFGNDGVVLHFKVPNSALDSLNTKTFDGDSQELRDFVRNFRSDKTGLKTPPYDVVEGPMLMNPKPFLNGKTPKWGGNQVVFYDGTGPLLDSSLQ